MDLKRPEFSEKTAGDGHTGLSGRLANLRTICFKPFKFRGWIILVTIVALASIYVWHARLQANLRENRAVSAFFDANRIAPQDRLKPSQSDHSIEDKMVQELNPKLLPGKSSHTASRHGRRLIFIGDIHGCKEELVDLLSAVKYNGKHDHIVTTGDVVNKGPDSVGVVQLLMEEQASGVRGNHDDKILRLIDQMHSSADSTKDIRSQSDASARDRKVAASLSPNQVEYLRSLPVILNVGSIDGFGGRVLVVHAGLVPGLPLNQQNSDAVMTMRLIDFSTRLPLKDHERHGALPWFRLWNKYQELLPTTLRPPTTAPPKGNPYHAVRTTVIYGHDSKKGLQIGEYTKGLDSGCVNGGQLTALVVADGATQKLVSVNCKKYR